MKKLLLITGGGAAVLALIFTLWNPFGNSEHVAIYKPRSAQAHMEYGAHDAMEVQHQMKKNYFTGQVEAEDILNTRRALKRHANKNGRDNDMEWGSLGPDNIGGRTRAVWINPQDDSHIVGGGVSGGLWQSFNSGNNWEPIDSFNDHEDFYQHMMISSIARTGSGVYYIGTGSQHENFNVSGGGTAGFVGGGLWRSTNSEGTAWENVFAPSPFDPNSEWVTVDAVVVDPNNTEKLWVAHNRGLDVYIHGNEDLETRPTGLPQTASPCEDVHVSTDGEVIVASIGNRGYISTNGGDSFEEISGNLANGGINILGTGGNNRIEFAIAPSDADYIYASVVNSSGNSLRGVLATFDRGENWYRIALDVNANPDSPFQPFGGAGGQGRWDNAIVVNPLNKKHIFLGGLIIYSHTITGDTPGLANWEERSIYSTNYTNPFAVHPDVHWFAWDSNNIFYAATDGGFFKSNDMATSASPMFYPANQGYVTTQFYGIAHSNDERTIGGTQDNGTLYQNQEGVTSLSGIEVFGGDGFDCDISFIRPTLLFGTSQFGNILRSIDGDFSENISPGAGSGDFTTNIRLIETENDPYSTRGTMFGVDTLHSAFVEDFEEWDDGDITLGFIPAGYWIMHNSDADQRELWTQTEENLYYYSRKINRDTILIPDLDTTDVIIDLTVIDSLVFPIDTTITQDCDTMTVPVDTTYTYQCDTISFPMDTTYVDSCTIFLGEEFCVHIDTLLNDYQDSLYCDLDIILDTTVVYIDSVFCQPPDTVITYDTEYTYDTTYTYIVEEDTVEFIERDTLYHVSDSLLLIDPVQSLLAVGSGTTGSGVSVTRDALNTSIDPEYWDVSNTSDMINCLEWSPDRNHLYLGMISGRLERISGFNKVYHESDLDSLTSQVLISSGPAISDIAVDYSQGTGGPDEDPASEMVVVTKSTYGTQDKVMVSMDAASTTSSNSFTNIWNIDSPLDRMPVYSCVINKEDPDEIVIGTEVGVFRTTDGGQNWVEENGGLMDRVPVFDLRQQYREAWKVENSGVIYAGTHGRGIFKNEDYFSPNTGVDDLPGQHGDAESLSNLSIFPNPMNTTGWVEFKLNQSGDVRANIFNINGQLVHEFARDNMPEGEHQISFDASRFSAGTYVLVMKAGDTVKSGRFIVTK